MKTITTNNFVKLATILVVAAPLAALLGNGQYH